LKSHDELTQKVCGVMDNLVEKTYLADQDIDTTITGDI
jgi:hypothetical protein